MMHRLNAVIVLFSAVLLTLLEGAPSKRQTASFTNDSYKLFSQNKLRTKNFSCSNPQPRAYHFKELTSDKIYTYETLRPSMTVLHRCDGRSGCCKEMRVCQPAENGIEDVVLVFKADQIGSTEFRYIPITAKNHTKCECGSRKHLSEL